MSKTELSCAICLESYDLSARIPQILQCFHTFCASCLEKMSLDKDSIVCPSCRAITNLPSKEKSRGLSLNFPLIDVLDSSLTLSCSFCDESHSATYICKTCGAQLCEEGKNFHCIKARGNPFRDHEVILVTSAKTGIKLSQLSTHVLCPKHDLDLRFLCIQDNYLVCNECIALEHHGHECKKIPEVYVEEAKDIVNLSKVIVGKTEEMKKITGKVETVLEELKEAQNVTKEEIHQFCEKGIQMWNEKEKQLLEEVEKIAQDKKQKLSQQLKELHSIIDGFQSATGQLQQLIEYKSEVRILGFYRQLRSHLNLIAKRNISNSPETTGEIQFMADTKVFQAIETCGEILDSSISPEQTVASGDGLIYAIPNKPALFSIIVKNAKGRKRDYGRDVFMIESKPIKVDINLVDNSNGTYNGTFIVPTEMKEERLFLSIQLLGRHIQGSPFGIQIKREKLTSPKTMPIHPSFPSLVGHPAKSSSSSSSLFDKKEKPGLMVSKPSIVSGVLLDFPMSKLEGWTLHYRASYNEKFTFDKIDPGRGEWILIGAKKLTDNETLYVAAMGLRQEVTRRTSDTTKAHEHNGIYWYCVPGYSFGFAPVEKINLCVADSIINPDRGRLSWPENRAGYRAGDCNNSSQLERLIYYF